MTADECIEKIVSIVCEKDGNWDGNDRGYNRAKLHRILQVTRTYYNCKEGK